MISEDLQEEACLYVAGVLGAVEQAAFEREVKLNKDLLKYVHGVQAVFEQVSLESVSPKSEPPPPSVKAHIMDLVKGVKAVNPAPKAPSFPLMGLSFLMADDSYWKQLPVPGIKVRELNITSEYVMLLAKLEPNTIYPQHDHSGPEECLVIEGEFEIAGRVIRPGDFHHAEGETHHAQSHTKTGCTVLLMVPRKDYHFAEVP